MDYLDKIVYLVLGGLSAAITWLIRTVITNDKRIHLLEADAKNRDTRRSEDKQDVEEIKRDVKGLRADLMAFMIKLNKD